MTHSPELSEIAKSISVIQGMGLKARRDETSEDGRLFASLVSVLRTLRPWWLKERLRVIQFSGVSDIVTLIVHEASGQFISERTTCEMRTDGGRAYSQRHVLMTLFGVVEQAEKKTKKKPVPIVSTWCGIVVPDRVLAVFQESRLNAAQGQMIAVSGKSEDEMIAEARRLGART